MKKLFCGWLLAGLMCMSAVSGQVKKSYSLKDFAATDTVGVQPSMLDSLPEIHVVAKKPLVKVTAEKTTYSMEDDPDARTSTILQMLRKVPMVTVDGDDNVKVNGSSSFRIYINGKPSNMLSNNPKEVLRSMPAGTVKKIEVITDPGARYDAEGVSGILNIVTRNSDFEGYKANLNAIMMNKVQVLGGYTTMKFGKLALSADYSYSHYDMRYKTSGTRRQFDSSEEALLSSENEMRVKTPGHYGALESSYELDSLNLISVSASVDDGRNKTTSSTLYNMSDAAGEKVFSYNQSVRREEDWGSASVKADYQHRFRRNNGEMLTLSYQYDYSPGDVNQYLNITDKQGDSPSLQYLSAFNHQLDHAKGHEHTLQLDYVNPLSEKHSLEGGLKYIRRKNLSDALSEQREAENDEWLLSTFQPELSYRHVQNIMAAYGGYGFTGGKWSVKSGLRMEHTWQDVTYRKGNGSDFDYQATDWVPSLSLLYSLNERQQLRLAYNMRLRRPGISYLNPYVLIDGSTMRYGNPDLTTSRYHRLTLSYSYFTPKVNVQLSSLYTHGSDVVGEYQFLDKNHVLNVTYGNVERMDGGQVSLYFSYMPWEKTSLSFNGALAYLDIRPEKAYAEKLAGVKNRGLSGWSDLTVQQKIGTGWQFVCSGGMGRPEISLGRHSAVFYYYGCYLGKSFMHDKLTVALRAQDFLSAYKVTKQREEYAAFTYHDRTCSFNRTFGITINYSFGSLKEKVKKVEHSIENDDLLKREGNK